MARTGTVRLADQPEDYRRFGVEPGGVQPFEDGRRIDELPHHFEWWYADAVVKLPGGDMAGLSVVFFTKPLTHPESALQPVVMLTLALPGRAPETRQMAYPAASFSAATGRCDVRIGPNLFQGDLRHYRIQVGIGNWSVTLELAARTDPIRIGTGHQLFTKDGAEHFFAWLPAVPFGPVRVTGDFDGLQLNNVGLGYHDHNWGDADMGALMHHWYWARARVDRYTVIAAHITAQAAYGSADIPVFVLLDDNVPVVQGQVPVRFEALEVDGPPDPLTGKRFARLTRYTWNQGGTRWCFSFRWTDTVRALPFDPSLPPDEVQGGAYHRFKGLCTLLRETPGAAPETRSAPAMWEYMYFGPPSPGQGFDQHLQALGATDAPHG